MVLLLRLGFRWSGRHTAAAATRTDGDVTRGIVIRYDFASTARVSHIGRELVAQGNLPKLLECRLKNLLVFIVLPKRGSIGNVE